MLTLAVIGASCAGARGTRTPSAGPESSAPGAKGAQFRLRDFRFKSGLRLVAEEDTRAPVIGVVNVVGAGSTSDPPGKEGLAHLVAHLTFRAKQSGQKMWSLFSQAGAGHLNLATHFDSTTYYEVGPRDAIFDLLALEGLRIVDPLAGVDDAVFAVEREVVRNELRQRGETIVSGAIWTEVLKATYPSTHAYARAPIGSHESLDRLTLVDARAFVKQHYRPDNMTLVVSGDLSLERMDQLLARALPASFDQPAPGAKLTSPRLGPHPVEPPAPPPANGIVTIEGMVTAPELYLSWSLPRSFAETSHLAKLAAGGLSSAIEHAIRVDNDAIGGGVMLEPGVESATVVARLVLREGSHPEKSAEYLRNGLVYNWAPNVSTTMQHQWFERRVARIATLMLFESEDLEERAVERAAFTHFTGDVSYYGHRMDALNAIGPSPLEEFYARYLNRDRARVVLVRPFPPDRQAPMGRVGIEETKEDLAAAKYDLSSLRKVAVSPGLARSFHTRTLPNGLTVETARHGTAPIATIGLAFRGGLAEESESGAAIMGWELATPGNPMHGVLVDQGAILDKWATHDSTGFRVRVLARQVEKVLAILADRMTSFRVRSDEFNWFERYGLAYRRSHQHRPELVGDRDFRRAIFGSHVFANTSFIPDDRFPDRDAANRWITDTITPARGVLAIVGDIDPDEAQRFAESAFGGWSGTPSPPDPAPLEQKGTHAEIITHRPGATQAVVHVGCRLPAIGAVDLLHAEVLATTISQHGRGIREQMGTTYGIGASVEILRGGTAVLHIGGAVENGGLAASLRSIRDDLTRVGNYKRGDLDRARWTVATRYNLGLATTDDWVNEALEAGKRGWSLESIDKVPEALATETNPLASALRACATDGVLSIVGDQTIAARAIADGWLGPKPKNRGSVARQ